MKQKIIIIALDTLRNGLKPLLRPSPATWSSDPHVRVAFRKTAPISARICRALT